MKKIIKRIPIIGPLIRNIFRKLFYKPKPFSGSENYWINRYNTGGNSGSGSYNELAEFKAEILNNFVQNNKIKSIIEYGCGDGNQLKLAKYPSYIGFDVAPQAIILCKEIYSNDNTKTFMLMDNSEEKKAQLALSLDVIYHLIEDNVFNNYMHQLFNSSERFVIIYSSNTDKNHENQAAHIKHRKFSEWIKEEKTEWRLNKHIPNHYPSHKNSKTSSSADFYIYEKS